MESYHYIITLKKFEIQDCLFPKLGVKTNQFDFLKFAVNHFAYRVFQYLRFKVQDSKCKNF
ncbi:hypothetical protein EO95_00540 [Methanosarcina sp. 1.H.T.1A.1]|nr:hypothetical protein EO93_01000 [Methanosarcina sp. 1.H.A.2.2]KKH95093.1 hypothetical protein EO95_00540 [Methanosarcina sp. 1.H.T.1A.1]